MLVCETMNDLNILTNTQLLSELICFEFYCLSSVTPSGPMLLEFSGKMLLNGKIESKYRKIAKNIIFTYIMYVDLCMTSKLFCV